MMTPINQPHKEIDLAMKMHLALLHDASFDLFAALLTILLGITSVLHSLVRIAYAVVGLSVWTLGVWIIALQSLRTVCAAHSSTSPFRKEVQDE